MKLSEIQKIIEEMAFPIGIKCIVCDDELPVTNRFCICKKCELKPLTLFCDVCGRAFDQPCIQMQPVHDKFKKSGKKIRTVYPAYPQNKKVLSEESEEPLMDSKVQTDTENSDKTSIKVAEQNEICKKCLADSPHFAAARAAFFYDGEVKNLIYKLKFGNARYLAPYMAEYMLNVLTVFLETDAPPDLITFVPMHFKKQKQRGYNQAELLARELASKVNIPVADALERTKDIKNVAKMTRTQRAEAIRGSIAVKDTSVTKDKSILLIDDVFTTGTTADECAKQLKAAGASTVCVLTFATNHV